jgi:putative polyhydroxyalkanoate system protein
MRASAFDWAEIAEAQQQMSCIYEEGELEDVLFFTKQGVNGRLSIDQNSLEVEVELGILMTPFRKIIEAEISKNLDKLLD